VTFALVKPGGGVDVDVERDVKQRVEDELADEGLTDVQISYHLTSIFDHSIFEALSKVIQKLIPQLPTLQALLNNLTHVCLFRYLT
jgi:Ras-related GTP-binding protein C/D